ncbi:MAG TPA: NUDIX hydrolase [Acidiferrobacteraceae bacterium]|nr:NUDIX hydrolase [Acidiferrobacteraceae bacterium]
MSHRPEPERWIYRGQVIDVVTERAEFPDGHSASLEIVRHPGGAAVVALNDRDEVCLLRQYRHVTGDWIWELPAGKRDSGEAPRRTAERELEEEAGVRAHVWQELGSIISSPGVFTEIVFLYLARNLEPGRLAHERLEYIERHWIPWTTAHRLALQGDIQDAKTVVGLLRAAALVAPDVEN